jgi:hypothetical protein
MTDDEIRSRLDRVYAALGDTRSRPEDIPVQVVNQGTSYGFVQDFTGGRSAAQHQKDLASVINEIMGIRDRARRWLKANGSDAAKVDVFIKSELTVSLVHDLANADKHGGAGRDTMSGIQAKLKDVSRGMSIAWDPVKGQFATSGQFMAPAVNFQKGATSGQATSSNLEIGLTGWVVDGQGKEICQVQRLIPDAIYKWEQFLRSNGLILS